MNVNAYPILTGAGGYNQTTALSDRYNSTNQTNNVSEPRTYNTPSSDSAITGYSANGDILEVSASSAALFSAVAATSGFAAFNAPQSGLDFYNAVVQHLRDTGFINDANEFERLVNRITAPLNSINDINDEIAYREGIMAQLVAQFEAYAQELQDMEDNIDAQENYLESLGDLTGALEDEIAAEEDRLDELASRLEDVLERQIERLDDRLEIQAERFDNRLSRRLDRLARRQLRFEARMGRRNDIEMNRRAEFEERMATLTPGSPEYLTARANETARRERFDANMARRTERHDRGMARANERHQRWYDRQQARLGSMQDFITQRMEANEAEVEAIRTNSPTIESLTLRIEQLEAQQADIEAYMATLQLQFEERQRELEPAMEQLEDVQIAHAESLIENLVEVRSQHQQLAAGFQAQIDRAIEIYRQHGMLPNQ
jgi:chromosome segregation ATPase